MRRRTWPRGPLQVAVTLRPDDEIVRLRGRIAELEARAAQLQAEKDRAEYKYRCEVVINSELVDLCRRHSVAFRPALAKRPY